MSDDKNTPDDSDWLAAQFDPTSQIPTVKPGADAAEPTAANGATPPADEPAASGFNWGLKPRGAAAAEPATPAAEPDPATEALPAAEVPPAASPPAAPTSAASPAASSAADDLDGEPTQAMTVQDINEVLAPFDRPDDTHPQLTRTAAQTAAAEAAAAADRALGRIRANPPVLPPLATPPTEATAAAAVPASAAVPPAATPPAAPVYPPVPPVRAAVPPREETAAIDKLFGDANFVEYDEPGVLPTLLAGPAAAPAPVGPAASTRPTAPKPERAPMAPAQKRLLWIIGSVVAVLAIVALYLVGTRIGDSSLAAAPATTKPTTSATPAPTATDGPVAAGVHAWDELQGGECITPFTTAFAEKFTVVDCGDKHVAQLISRGELDAESGAAYPGADELQKQLVATCSGTKVLNYKSAARASDIQISTAFPATEAEWNDGDRDYFCFVTRESGKNISGNLAKS